MKSSYRARPGKWLKFILPVLVVLVVIAGAGVAMLRLSPATGAYGADYLRRIIGNRPVAAMEMALFRLEDAVRNFEYKTGLMKAEDPFSVPAVSVSPPQQTGTDKIGALVTEQSTPVAASPAVGASGTGGSSPSAWVPAPIASTDGQPGSGEWAPYLQDPSGRVVAYRAYLQPDPNRPYAYTAVVAFDLAHTRLHYKAGFADPYAPGIKKRADGTIPPGDQQPGYLLAAFNGGFKYEHGHFGSMEAGFVTAPPLDGMGTLLISTDGKVQMVEWGKTDISTGNLYTFRQNGPLVIQDGAISPRVDNSLIWGETVTGNTVTLRSGLALSSDGRTLYYLAGTSLTVKTLASAMLAIHAQEGIQLDINNFWVHFTAFHAQNGQNLPEALLAKEMKGDLGRFLKPYPRDFFYVTALP